MRIVRKPAYQGHAIPRTASHPKGPFNPEVLAEPVVVMDDGEPTAPFNANAQNNMRGEKLFQCTYCSEVITESEVDAHWCGDDDGS